jgi:hypothetical protein
MRENGLHPPRLVTPRGRGLRRAGGRRSFENGMGHAAVYAIGKTRLTPSG